MAGTDWAVNDGAIVEQPRDVRKHPLLAEIYHSHDERIAAHLSPGETLELAFGQHMHPDADVGVEARASNADAVSDPAVAGDARSLPFEDGSFQAVVGRRFLHHVPPSDRTAIMREARRVLAPGGRVILLEGTPGLYRRLTKNAAFKLGLLEEDTDIYGHLAAEAVARPPPYVSVGICSLVSIRIASSLACRTDPLQSRPPPSSSLPASSWYLERSPNLSWSTRRTDWTAR